MEISCLVYSRRIFPLLIKEKRQLTYLLVVNLDIVKEIQKYVREKINKLGQHMMHMYIHYTVIPKMLEVMANGKTKSKLLKKYSVTKICQDTIEDWIIKLGFTYNYDVKNYYVAGYEKKDMIWYRWKSIDCYLLL